MELEQRLGLYQVFLKLYDHHRALLDEILQLENIGNGAFIGIRSPYVQGIIHGHQIYLIANLLNNQTQILLQSQFIWTIGRDRYAAFPIDDNRLSRRHAVIQYVEGEGFYLIDLNSTNGSYVNSEPVWQPHLLKDGDRIRLGSLTFSFFLCQDIWTLPDVSPDLLTQLNSLKPRSPDAINQNPESPNLLEDLELSIDELNKETARFWQNLSSNLETPDLSVTPQLDSAQQSEILDRFFKQK